MERVQKSAVRVILGRKYTSYRKGLEQLNLDGLNERRTKICLKFAKNCLKNEKVKDIFPKAELKHKMRKRKQNAFKVKRIKTERYKKSAVPYMTELLNNDAAKRRRIMKETE